ncbi:hypothetical protein N7486_001687 [Penicillium sp. IBT 16267x]|nr:hypothetical protein N7486_001687 [Penicillium sp. IBT 16267x]
MALVKTAAVAINPADAKMLDYSAAPGAIHGYDFAGTVVALGTDALGTVQLEVGDRVAGFVHGMNRLQPEVGAFAQYVGASADMLLKIPDQLSFEEAATLGVGVGTAALRLFQELRNPASLEQLREGGTKLVDNEKREFVLVAGGSTATGTCAIQLLKLEIRAYTRGQLAYALDCVSLADTTEMCNVSLEPFRKRVAQSRPTVEASWLMVLSLFGREAAHRGALRALIEMGVFTALPQDGSGRTADDVAKELGVNKELLVLHDWSDEVCVKILQNIATAITDKFSQRVVIAE